MKTSREDMVKTRNACAGLLLAALCLASTAPALAGAPLQRDLWSVSVTLNPDLTYTETIEQDFTLLTASGISLADRDFVTFEPASQTLELLEARVTQPDGTVDEVPPGARFTRPSEASRDTPGFSSSETTTILFPKLQPGSRTHVKWRLTQRVPQALGFSLDARPLLEWPTAHMRVSVDAPAAVELHWGERAGETGRRFAVQEETGQNGRNHLVASLDNMPGQAAEPNEVSGSDVQPLFSVSTVPGWEALGATYYRQSIGKADVTPAVAALSRRIVGDLHGLDAVRAIHNWIAGNIRYVAIYMDPDAGFVPHAADAVLASGYGDCKDHVVLLQALAAAAGVKVEPVLVDWSTRYREPPVATSRSFNHVIAYLPEFGLYLDPTNAHARIGVLDWRLSGKRVVRATETGQLAETPPSNPDDNSYRMDSVIALSADGTLTGQSEFLAAANIEAGLREDVGRARSSRDLVRRMLGATPEGGYGEMSASDPKDLARPFTLSAAWLSPRGVDLSGPDAFFTLPVGVDFEQPSVLLRPYLASGAPRRTPVLAYAMRLEWRTRLILPPGFAPARLPQDTAIGNETGSYAAHYELAGHEIIATRTLVVARDVYAASLFPALQDLFYATLADTRAVVGVRRLEARAGN